MVQQTWKKKCAPTGGKAELQQQNQIVKKVQFSKHGAPDVPFK